MDIQMTQTEYAQYEKIVKRVKAVLEANGIVTLADYLREYNKAHPRAKIAFSTAAQACNEGRIPALQMGERTLLLPRGAIEAAVSVGMLTGKRGRAKMAAYIEGACPVCDKTMRGTTKGLTVKHTGADGAACAGWGLPLVKPRKVKE